MNCKPGDLAVIVVTDLPGQDALVGSLLRCVRLDVEMSQLLGRPEWQYEAISRRLPDDSEHTVSDSSLRPIRDPGEDAKDETLSWLSVPMKDSPPSDTTSPSEKKETV